VKATYDKIVSPPPGVVSLRQAPYTVVERIEAPDPRTVVQCGSIDEPDLELPKFISSDRHDLNQDLRDVWLAE
jgi:hypothetical protein